MIQLVKINLANATRLLVGLFVVVGIISNLRVDGATPENCGVTLESLGLTATQGQKIHEADESSHFKVKVYRGIVGGIPRTIVMLGESHYKNENDSELGKRVVQEFNHIGLEGVQVDQYWGGKYLLSPMLDGIQWMFKFFSAGKINKGSTIGDAQLMAYAQTAEFKEEIRKLFSEMSAKDLQRLRELTAEEKSKSPIDISLDGGSIKFPIDDILKILDEEPLTNMAAPENPIKTYHLEKGHRPKIWEQAASIGLPLWMGYAIYGWGASLFSIGSDVSQGKTGHAFQTAVILGTGITLAVLQIKFRDRFPIAKIITWPISAAIDVGFGYGRNQTMIRNSIEVFEQDSNVRVLINIVGAGHVSGMGSGFMKKHGFEEIPVSGL
jgi:hypothetical protein